MISYPTFFQIMLIDHLRPSLLLIFSLAWLNAGICRAQIVPVPDFSKGQLFVPADAPSTIGASHVKVPGLGNYDIKLAFNSQTWKFDIVDATPSQTNENTELMGGLYNCHLYNATLPMFSVAIHPVGNDLLFGGGLQYRFLGTSGTAVWKYTVSFSDGGKYLLSMVKDSATAITAVLGYLAPGQVELDLANTLKCEKNG